MAATDELKIRNKGVRRIRVADLEDAPWNFRTHPEAQRGALAGIVDQLGWYGYPDVYETEEGKLRLCDGHLRKSFLLERYGEEAEIEVNVTDFVDHEAKLATATKDPLAAMAKADGERLDGLLRDVDAGSEGVQAMLADLADSAGLNRDGAAAPTGDREATLQPSYSVLVKCSEEQEQLALLAELDRHGLEARAMCIGWPEPPAIEHPEGDQVAPDEVRIVRKSSIKRTPRVQQLEGMFDVPPAKERAQSWNVKLPLDKPWNVGLIVGPSGSGKTTIARELFGDSFVTDWTWPKDRSLIDGFPAELSISEIVSILSSIGFSSPPSWLKPFHVLSNGEQFRVNLARTLAEKPELAVIDEFSSVVDRTVAQIGSHAVAKAVRASQRKLIAVTCHYDVEEWLQPDWRYDVARDQFDWRCLRRRPEIQLRIRRVAGPDYWPQFRQHHYLSSNLHPGAVCFMAEIDGRPAAFTAVLSQPSRRGGFWREHRTVCMPDFQGCGIGNAMSEFVASLYASTGKRYQSTTSHPAMIRHRSRSPLWRMVRSPSFANFSASAKMAALLNTVSATCMTTAFRYVGPSRPEEARTFGVLKTASPKQPAKDPSAYPGEHQTAPTDRATESTPPAAEDSPTPSRKARTPKGRRTKKTR